MGTDLGVSQKTVQKGKTRLGKSFTYYGKLQISFRINLKTMLQLLEDLYLTPFRLCLVLYAQIFTFEKSGLFACDRETDNEAEPSPAARDGCKWDWVGYGLRRHTQDHTTLGFLHFILRSGRKKQPLLGSWITKNTFLPIVSVWSPKWKERKVLDSLHCSSASTGQPGRTLTSIPPQKKNQNSSRPKVFSSANTSRSLYVVPKFLGPAGSIEIKIFQLIKVVVETIAGIPHDKLQILQEAFLTSLAPSSEITEDRSFGGICQGGAGRFSSLTNSQRMLGPPRPQFSIYMNWQTVPPHYRLFQAGRLFLSLSNYGPFPPSSYSCWVFLNYPVLKGWKYAYCTSKPCYVIIVYNFISVM